MQTTVHRLTAITFCNGYWFAVLEFTVYSRSGSSPPPGLATGRFYLVRAFTGRYQATPFNSADEARRAVDHLVDAAANQVLYLPESEWHADSGACVPEAFGPREKSRTDPTEAWMEISLLGPPGDILTSPAVLT
ncbi:hypothetical protein FIV34_11885 [Luteibacter pinisoli]|uniref:Uncharacterized protein n=1 Tax=Luteibacter pinisoli TaxID=2589080 RepID=A0A4Y5Z396_9GAMM|nr:hypothetical protein [Luteibacter pinisoli]QDE39860.1 hypothetical protein FIV34_11885 [Luteibacter pinisoli]